MTELVLNERERAAYRLGLLDFMARGIEDGELEMPERIIWEVMDTERETLRKFLAEDHEWDEAHADVRQILVEEARHFEVG